MTTDYEGLKERMRTTWSLGRYDRVAERIESASLEVLRAAGVGPGDELLDVAAGTGNLAIAAARLGAIVTASDLTPAMIEKGRARADAEGVVLEWVEADAEDLPFEDERFDAVTSVFGAMFAPRPDVVASELFRVARPGGTVAMASWVPGSYLGRTFEVTRRYVPAPDVPLPTEWGRESVIRERFAPYAAGLETFVRSIRWEHASIEELKSYWEDTSPSMIAAKRALDPARYEEMVRDLQEVVEETNEATDGSISLASDYLVVVARKAGS